MEVPPTGDLVAESYHIPRPNDYDFSTMEDRLSTELHRDGDGIVIAAVGVIDIATAERLRDAIEPHLGPRQMIVLDLSGVEFMDSASLHVLEQARGTLTADGGSLMLRNPSRAARHLLSIAGLNDLLLEDATERASH